MELFYGSSASYLEDWRETSALDTKLDSEALLEEQITGNMSIACCIWMLIGRQVYIYFGKCIDLLATDDVSIILIFELKCIGTNVWAGVIRRLRSSPLRGSRAAVLTRCAR
ncbi:hypothetical protein [Microbulbifer sp. SH-1]|uniref:hypothetical protein n=1 Tax=Microbulbifer sp. SH-1 TaxID=2681547 RepID=UPI00197B9D95|nr:hypothetical protein [Microbulbifer sp. SH-1]